MDCRKYIEHVYNRLKTILSIYGRFFAHCILVRYRQGIHRKYPTILQLPITFKCNFDCVMCGMRQLIGKHGFTPEELRGILSDKIFSKISSVGVNGGEPFLLNNLEDYISVLLDTLPGVKDIYIISNGYFSNRIVEKSKEIIKICHNHQVKYHLSISLDGYAKIQDEMRGKDGAFNNAIKTCDMIVKNGGKYCDTFGTICTVTKINVDYLPEIDTWTKMNNIPIGYNIATIHERIQNSDKFQEFSVFTDEHSRMMAEEFFYSKYLESFSELYYSLYYYVNTQKRIAICDHKINALTLTPDGNLSYCATHSKNIGNAFAMSAGELFFSKENLAYRKCLHKEYCDQCSHYSGTIDPRYYLATYARERIRRTRIFR